ncbi:MAG: ISKra4 family transposase [Peptococcaceae bacterium]|jgi:hypothetical protein|nr:ISKra4 family transposase [Peptococcaceae bacterium]
MTATTKTFLFDSSQIKFERIAGTLQSPEAVTLSHSDVENMLQAQGRELMRVLFQDHLNLRTVCESGIEGIVDAQGVPRKTIERNKKRTLTTVFGDLDDRRIAYRRCGLFTNIHPADAVLNLPDKQYSFGLRRLAAIESTRGSFEDAIEVAALTRTTEVHLGKRQLEEQVLLAAADFNSFYTITSRPKYEPGDVLVITADGKGINMRTEALRDATAKAAQSTKPATRLVKGQKCNGKRMAEVGGVYYATPVTRTPGDILNTSDNASGKGKDGPVAKDKWLTASVVENAATVVSDIFNEAERRYPDHALTWVVLVEGNIHQLNCIKTQAKARKVKVNIVIDFIHMLEYVWKAAHSFYKENDPAAEAWVAEKALAILCGRAGIVAAAIKRKATCLHLDRGKREAAETCNKYLLNKIPYLKYHIALKRPCHN